MKFIKKVPWSGPASSRLPVMLREGHPPSPDGSRLRQEASARQAGGTGSKVKLSREELIRLVTWIDANVPYYGTYRGRIGIHDKDHPDFRALPLTMK